jgi:SAM-dependent methyltransferase
MKPFQLYVFISIIILAAPQFHEIANTQPCQRLSKTTKALNWVTWSTLSLATEMKWVVMWIPYTALGMVDFSMRIFGHALKDGFSHTGRGVFQYYAQLGLYNYDFEGKRVLDVGAGGSHFAHVMNLQVGTRATAMDKYGWQFGKFLGNDFVKADAFEIPFENHTFDLLTSNYFYAYFLTGKFSIDMKEAELDKKELRELFNEAIRVTKSGGEIRFTYTMLSVRSEAMNYVLEHFNGHPSVHSVDVTGVRPIGGFTGYVSVVLK